MYTNILLTTRVQPNARLELIFVLCIQASSENTKKRKGCVQVEGKVFTGEIARLGKWNGKASEGFVGRTHFSVPPTSRGK
ncbi:hypothetical protein BD309DRAFT_878114, partial [Dichomitus squalens]